MKRLFFATLGGLIILCGTLPTVFADNRQLLGTYRDWDAFMLQKSSGAKVCYMISIPKKKLPQSLSHGNPFLTVSHKPARQIKNEVNFVAGYNFKKNSVVRMAVDRKKKYGLFTAGDGAWGDTAKMDNAMAQAMKRGSSMVITALSGRGNKTTYHFSLSGFTAAHNAITKACR